jgi:peptidoglycan/LPS O-acetylase OafA/YrhL
MGSIGGAVRPQAIRRGYVTAGEIMAANRGVAPGFDWVRIALSLIILLLHSFHTADGHAPELASGPTGPLWAATLPMFFGLSGFLVAGSALRTRALLPFITFRVLRIVPALAVEVTLSALLLGPLVTALPLPAYFSDPALYHYFGNIVGWVHFHLPGVFLTNPRPDIVNQNLWTLHPELGCYALMAALMASRLVYSRRAMTIVFAAFSIGLIAWDLGVESLQLNGNFGRAVLVWSFVAGITAFHWRDHLPVSRGLALASAALAYGLLRTPGLNLLALFPIIYLMVWLGVQHFPRIELLQRGDYSYGIYLYGYPIQQTLVFLFPGLREWWLVFPVAAMLTLLFAMLSWHGIEKPALRLKRLVKGRPKPIASLTEPA